MQVSGKGYCVSPVGIVFGPLQVRWVALISSMRSVCSLLSSSPRYRVWIFCSLLSSFLDALLSPVAPVFPALLPSTMPSASNDATRCYTLVPAILGSPRERKTTEPNRSGRFAKPQTAERQSDQLRSAFLHAADARANRDFLR